MDPYSVSSSSSDDVNPPRLFLNWPVLQQLLQEATDGEQIKHTLLLKADGSLLTSSYEQSGSASSSSSSSAASLLTSTQTTAPSPVLPKILGALVANIFKQAESNGINFLQSQSLNMMILDCEDGVVAVARLSRFLICMYATKEIDGGRLRLKMNELIANLQPLHKVYAQ